MLNDIKLIGRVSKEPNLKVETEGNHQLFFDLAVGRNYVKPGEERETDYIPIAAFGKLAEIKADRLKKGPELVLVEGSLQTWFHENENGTKEKKMGVKADRIVVLGKFVRDNNQPDTPENQ